MIKTRNHSGKKVESTMLKTEKEKRWSSGKVSTTDPKVVGLNPGGIDISQTTLCTSTGSTLKLTSRTA